MRFQWPELLWLLGLVPLLVLGYGWLLRRRQAASIQVGSLALVRAAVGQGRRWRRHVPPLLLLVAVLLSLVALARPMAVLSLPSVDKTLILAVDVSGSMRAKDVAPDRITAARQALREFLTELPASTRVALVGFAATASVAQPPTLDRDELASALDRLTLQRGTATGSAILVALQVLFPDLAFNLQSENPRLPSAGAAQAGARAGQKSAGSGEPGRDAKTSSPGAAQGAQPGVAPGSFGSAAILLVSDGQRNVGPDAIEAARMAAERGVRIFTIGIGTPAGEVLSGEGWSMRVKLDESSLRQIADITRGSYLAAGSAAELRSAYESLSARVVFERREMEITALFTAAAALAMLLAAGLSVWWLGRFL